MNLKICDTFKRIHDVINVGCISTFFRYREYKDLYTGDDYPYYISKIFKWKYPIFCVFNKLLRKSRDLFIGRVGGYSRFFKRDATNEERKEEIRRRWEESPGNDLIIGSGQIISLEKIAESDLDGAVQILSQIVKKAKHASIWKAHLDEYDLNEPSVPDELDT